MHPSDLEARLKQLGKTREVPIPPEFREHIEAIVAQLRVLRRHHRHSTVGPSHSAEFDKTCT